MPMPTRMMHDPDDDWAQVELFRWQYGSLPAQGDSRVLDVPTALEAMSAAITAACNAKDLSNCPSPMNVSAVLEYCARLIRSK